MPPVVTERDDSRSALRCSGYVESAAKCAAEDLEQADDEEEEVFCCDSSPLTMFDAAVGALQDIVVSDEFMQSQTEFFARHCSEFGDGGEMSFRCTQIHENFVELMERTLMAELQRTVDGFSPELFLSELAERGDDAVDGPLWDLLCSLTDFVAFRELMLEHKAMHGAREAAAAPSRRT
eukprot:TRINITY_DN7882_c0_g2_i1.p1 TRINITY_DN7882_c0_g2~~TRINITY_DN7882_c0_g2_i1.p1  ORF type:complete len:179 (+),score=50.94 TRINITY_DN7882_c0_g2_i1:82-618(+)